MKPFYKKVKVLRPHCPVCKQELMGDNSVLIPYRCKCGEWEQDIETLELKPKLKCPCGKHSLKQYQAMAEAKASSELEGAKTDLTECELLDKYDL